MVKDNHWQVRFSGWKPGNSSVIVWDHSVTLLEDGHHERRFTVVGRLAIAPEFCRAWHTGVSESKHPQECRQPRSANVLHSSVSLLDQVLGVLEWCRAVSCSYFVEWKLSCLRRLSIPVSRAFWSEAILQMMACGTSYFCSCVLIWILRDQYPVTMLGNVSLRLCRNLVFYACLLRSESPPLWPPAKRSSWKWSASALRLRRFDGSQFSLSK